MSTKTEHRKKFRVPATQPWEKIVDQFSNEMKRVSDDMVNLAIEMLGMGEIAERGYLTKHGTELLGAALTVGQWATDIREVEK